MYALHDSVPRDYLSEYVVRLLERVVEPGGRLALGAYGSHSRRVEPLDVAGFLASEGHQVKGCADAGDPTIARFAWIDG